MFTKTMNIERVEDIVNIFGDFDGNIKKISKEFSVRITQHGGTLTLNGDPENYKRILTERYPVYRNSADFSFYNTFPKRTADTIIKKMFK